MDRFSRASLWTLVGAALTASGCADVLGFKDFSGPDGGDLSSNPSNVSPQGGNNGTDTGGATAAGSQTQNGGDSSNASTGSSDPSSGTPGNSGTGTSGDTTTGSDATSTGNGGSTTTGNATSTGSGTTGGGGGTTATGGSSSSQSAPSGGGTATSSSSSQSAPGGGGAATSSSSSSKSTTSSSSSSQSTTTTSSSGGSCTFGTAFNGDASFTFYFFGQGTAMSNGEFKTACGYAGTETGSGQSAVDTVPNAANDSPAKDTYFAAIPNSSGTAFNTADMCGACVEITNGGTSIVATIIDECPVGSNPACESTGHLDLSTQAFDALGYSTGDPSGTTWEFVPCPEGTKNIQAVENSAGQYYLQSSVYPISTVNGQAITENGFFDVNPGTVTVTSQFTSQTITINIPSGGGDTGANFTAPSGCF